MNHEKPSNNQETNQNPNQNSNSYSNFSQNTNQNFSQNSNPDYDSNSSPDSASLEDPSLEKESTPTDPYSRRGRLIMRFLEHTQFPEVRQNPEQFEEFIQSLDADTATDYLKRLNGMLRNVSFKKRGYQPRMSIEGHLAPPLKIQKANYASALDAMKQIKNPHYRAALAFYTINNQHTFRDGNGRTSRAVFEILDNPDFDLDQSFYQHENNQESTSNRNQFEEDHHLHSTASVNAIINKLMTRNLAREGKIDSRISGARRFNLLSAPEMISPDIYFTPEADSELTERQKKDICYAFRDEDIAKLALCEVLQDKGAAEKVITENTNEGQGTDSFNISIPVDQSFEDPELVKQTFSGWTKQDYVHFMQNFFHLETEAQETLNDIFLHPENYPLSDPNIKRITRYAFNSPTREISDDKTLADWLVSTR